jgi:uncharacterized protein
MLRHKGKDVRRAADVVNASKGALLASDARWAVTSRERRRGLIGRERMDRGEALVIPRCRQVHTFGMNFPIDVVFLDRLGVVVKACSRLRPGRVSTVVWRARDVIELPAGIVEESSTERGDQVLTGFPSTMKPGWRATRPGSPGPRGSR